MLAQDYYPVRHEGADNQRVQVPPEQCSVQLGSYLSGQRR